MYYTRKKMLIWRIIILTLCKGDQVSLYSFFVTCPWDAVTRQSSRQSTFNMCLYYWEWIGLPWAGFSSFFHENVLQFMTMNKSIINYYFFSLIFDFDSDLIWSGLGEKGAKKAGCDNGICGETMLLETSLERRRRRISLWTVYFTTFIQSLGFSIVLAGVWPYLLQVSPCSLLH